MAHMLVLVLTLSLVQVAARPPPARDVAVIGDADDTTTAPRPELAKLPVAEIQRRIATLTKQNKRAFSDRRVLLIQELKAELERRSQEIAWDQEQRKREAEQAAATAKLEAQYLADQQRQREVDEAARQAIAAARAAAEAAAQEQARLEEEERAAVQRRAVLRWSIFGTLALAVALGAAIYWKRR